MLPTDAEFDVPPWIRAVERRLPSACDVPLRRRIEGLFLATEVCAEPPPPSPTCWTQPTPLGVVVGFQRPGWWASIEFRTGGAVEVVTHDGLKSRILYACGDPLLVDALRGVLARAWGEGPRIDCGESD
jgi:hypothetical protein